MGSEVKHTPGPWIAREQFSQDGKSLGWIIEHANGRIGWSSYATAEPNEGEGPPYTISAANAKLIAAATELLDAAQKLEAAETFNANCDECEGEGVPELCEKCFPLFDDARIARRLAISKACPPPPDLRGQS